MHRLSQIFPADYPNIPTYEELQFEAQDLLCHSESPMDIIHAINKIACPYYRKAMANCVQYQWHQMEQNGIEPAVYIDTDGHWRITWISFDYDIRTIIKQANAQQAEREQKQKEDNTTQATYTNNPKNTTTMPLIINGDPQVINHYEGAHYENCTFYTTPTTLQSETIEEATILPVAQRLEPNINKFRSLLTVPYLNRKRECEAMIELITRDGFCKKDRARFALALYKSGNVALQRENIRTFADWWRTCCNLLAWEGADAPYKESQLTPNNATKQIKLYL